MIPGLIGMVLDGIILLLLAGTMFFAVRLSLQLRDFRKGRDQMGKLVKDLAASVGKAEQAMAGMRETAREAGRDLQEQINEANALSDELQIMIQAGDNLAARLEKVSERKAPAQPEWTRPAPPLPAAEADSSPRFHIRDPEFGRDGNDEDKGFDDEDDDGWGGAVSGMSRAERELYEALRTSGGKSRAGGRS